MATLAELHAKLATYQNAEDAIVMGAQSYEIAGRKVTKANLPAIQAKIAELEQRIAALRGNRHGQAVFAGRR
ncbi:MAG: hypothetical protein KKA55_01795 [Proteobacteria bacterium]|nr:hypothetical protein [Pseudomonadota bacterium]MBU1594251.1 hypothetical protein [Pseudomonadota bacterium]